MNPFLSFKILCAQLHREKTVNIAVTGISMNPTMYEGDEITVCSTDHYKIGDILVFFYKEELLVHRLLKTEGNLFFCKGDNAFRLEDITHDNIAGKVILHNQQPLSPPPPWLVPLSLQINHCFHQCGFSVEQTKQTTLYRFYYQALWKTEDNNMLYHKNTNMDYIPSDETSLAVFDPDTGDTHFFDETGIDILSCLENPCNLETLLERLCDIYDATPDDIREDVIEFLDDVVAKKVVIVA